MVEMWDGNSEFESTWIEFSYTEQQREYRLKKSEQNVQDLGDRNKRANLRTISVPEEEGKEHGMKGIWNT